MRTSPVEHHQEEHSEFAQRLTRRDLAPLLTGVALVFWAVCNLACAVSQPAAPPPASSAEASHAPAAAALGPRVGGDTGVLCGKTICQPGGTCAAGVCFGGTASAPSAAGKIGVQLVPSSGFFAVDALVPGMPAEEVLLIGDILVAVDGRSLEGLLLEQAVATISGAPETPVRLTVVRPGDQTPFDVSIVRH